MSKDKSNGRPGDPVELKISLRHGQYARLLALVGIATKERSIAGVMAEGDGEIRDAVLHLFEQSAIISRNRVPYIVLPARLRA